MSNKLLLHMDGVLVDKSSNNMSVSGSPSFVSEGLSTSASSFSASYTATNSFTVSFFATVNSSGTEASPNTLFNFGDFPLQVGLSSGNELIITFRNYKWKLPSAYGFSYGSKNHYSLMVDMSSSGGSRLFVNGSYNTPFYVPTVSEIAAASSDKTFGSSVSLGSGGSYYIKEFRIDDGYVNIFETQKARLKADFNGTLTDSSSFANAAVYTAQSGSATPNFAPFLSATVTFSPAPASGTFKFTYGGSSTANINWNDNASTIQSKLRALARMEDAVVSGSISGGLSIACGYIGTGLTATSNALAKSGGGAVSIGISESQDSSNRAWTSVTLNNNIGKIAYSDFKFGGYGDFTIDMKAKLMPVSSPSERTYYKVLSIGGDVNNNFAFSLLYNTTGYSAGRFRITRTVGGVATNYDFGSGFTPNKEVHLALVLNGLALTVYMNGTSQGIYTFSSSDFFFQQGLILNPDYSFNGAINDFRITNYVVYSGDFSSDRTKSLDNTNYSDIQPKTFSFPVSSLATPSNAIDQGAVLAAGGAGYPGSYPTGVNDPGLSVTYVGNSNTGGSAPVAGSYSLDGTATISSGSGLSRTHYTFGGWNTAANGSGTTYSSGSSLSLGLNSFNLYALWVEDPKYSVTYYANNGTGAVPVDSSTYYVDSSVSVQGAGALTREHYTFGGWNTAADGSSTTYSGGGSFSMGSGNVSLYAVWTPMATYHITYHANGALGSVPVDYGVYYSGDSTSVAGSGSLSKTNYNFSGWSLSPNGSIVSSITIGGDVDLYAIFVEKNKYNIYYDGKGSEQNTPSSQHYEDSQFNIVGAVTKHGYTFQGWVTATNYPTSGTLYQAEELFTMPSSNVTLYAYWNVAPTYKVYYYDNGGTGEVYGTTSNIDPSDYYQGDTVSVFSDTGISRNGYTFGGWNTAANGSGTSYTVGQFITMGSSNINIYAQWNQASYSVSYNTNNGTGSVTDSNSYLYNDTAVVKPVTGITRSDYKFTGWNTINDGSGTSYAAGSNLTVNGNTTLYAQWVRAYKIYYNESTSFPNPVSDGTQYEAGSIVVLNDGSQINDFYVWNTSVLGNGMDYNGGETITMPNHDLTLHALIGYDEVVQLNRTLQVNYRDPIYVRGSENKAHLGVVVIQGPPVFVSSYPTHHYVDSDGPSANWNSSYNVRADGTRGNELDGSQSGDGNTLELWINSDNTLHGQHQNSAQAKKAIKDLFSLTSDDALGSFQVDFKTERAAPMEGLVLYEKQIFYLKLKNTSTNEYIEFEALGSPGKKRVLNSASNWEEVYDPGYIVPTLRCTVSASGHPDITSYSYPGDVYGVFNVPKTVERETLRITYNSSYKTMTLHPYGISVKVPELPTEFPNSKAVINFQGMPVEISDRLQCQGYYAIYLDGIKVTENLEAVTDVSIIKQQIIDNVLFIKAQDPSKFTDISFSEQNLIVTGNSVSNIEISCADWILGGANIADRISVKFKFNNEWLRTANNEIIRVSVVPVQESEWFTISDSTRLEMSIGSTSTRVIYANVYSSSLSAIKTSYYLSGTINNTRQIISYQDLLSLYPYLPSLNDLTVGYNLSPSSQFLNGGKIVQINGYDLYVDVGGYTISDIPEDQIIGVNVGDTIESSSLIDTIGADPKIIEVGSNYIVLSAPVSLNGGSSGNQSIRLGAYSFASAGSYTVSYNSNGGNGSLTDSNSYSNGDYATIKSSSFSRSGYIFDHWNTAADGSGTNYVESQIVQMSSALTLYAVWIEGEQSQGLSLQVKKKFINNSNIDETKILFNNDAYFKALKSDASEKEVFKVNAQNKIEFADEIVVPAATADSNMINRGQLSTAVAAEQSRAVAAEGSLSANISVEQSRAMAAESSISSAASAAVAAEQSRAVAAEGSVSASVAAEISRATAAEGSLQSQINSLDSGSSAAISAEESRAMAAEAGLSSDIAAEESRAMAAEAGLSSDIAAEESRAMAAEGSLQSQINSIISNTDPAALDSLTEIVDAFQNADVATTTAINNLSSSAAADVAAEESRAMAAEGSLSASVAAEKSRAMAAEGSLSASVAAEGSRAMAAEGSLSASVATEQSRATAAEAGLSSDIAAEESRAMAAEGQLTSDLAAEVSRATAAEGSLSASVAAEESRAMAAEASVFASGEAEALRAQAAEGVLTSDLAAEVSRATAAEGSLSAAISAEASRATAAEGSLSAAVAAEESRAMAAEGSLQSQINSIISNTDPAMLDSMTEIVAAFEAADGDLSTTISNLASSVAADLAAEVSRATAAEGSLSAAISAEASRATAAEAALDSRVDLLEAIVNEKEKFVLTSQDIANGYIELSHVAITKSTFITADRLPIHEGSDYTISVVNGKTRITFIGSMIGSGDEVLVADDTVLVEYCY